MRDYTQQLTVEQFGGMVATATRAVGSARGPYLGYTPTGAPLPVRFDPTQAPREDRASGVLLIGTLGSGKTVAAQAIAYAAQRRGSLIVDFDPKPDHGWENLPELADQLQVLELSGDPSQQGRLDPLAIGLQDMREELACSYLLELLPGPSSTWENAVSLAVKDAVREGSHSLLRVVELLHDSDRPGAREAGEALEVIRDFGLARLGFGDGSGPSSTTQAAVTTIRMPGLSLPEPSAARDTYTRAERVSVATLSLVAAYALRLISGDRSRHKVVGLDEIWFLLASPQGRQVINRLVRLGRAFNATLLLGTHRIGDLGHLSDLIGVVFVFGQDSDDAARAALRFIGVDTTRELIGLVREFRAGRCLMRDLHGRVGEVQIDLVDPRLLAAFQTTPGQPLSADQPKGALA
jgi:AAA-like domain